MKRLVAVLIVVICGLCLSSCSALRTLRPGGATIADLEFDGVKSAEVVSVIGTIDSRVAAVSVLLEALGQADPVGVLMPITPIGSTEVRWVLCAEQWAAKCRAIPLQAKVHFAGQPIGPGLLWKPSRVTADDFND
jgi:hypothetical protein